MKNLRKILGIAVIVLVIASFAVICASAASLKSIVDIDLADYSKIYFKGETNKDFTTYEVGETMIFTMSLYADDLQITAPYFYYSLEGDDGGFSSGFVAPDENGFAVIEGSVKRNGAVRLVVHPCNDTKNIISASNLTKFEGGAIAGAKNIQPTAAEPLDFDEFWAGQLALLDECAPDLFYLEKITSTNSNYDAYIVKVNCIGDASMVATGATWTAGVLSVPKNASAGSLGFNLLYYGYGVKTAEQSHNANYITFAVCAHSIEQLQDSSYYDNAEALGLTNYGFSAEENALPYTSYFRGMLLRDVQAVRFLQKYFGAEGGESSFGDIDISSWKGLWNGKDIYTRGSSQGGFQAISVAALVPEVTRIYAGVPWFGDVAGNTVSTRIQSSFRPTYAEGLRYYDTAFMAKRVKASVINITSGTGDTLCPMYATQSIYNSFDANVSMIYRQGMTHSNTKTYPIEFAQSKKAGDKVSFGKDAFLLTGINASVLKDAWETLTGMEAECFDSSADIADSDADRRIGFELFSSALDSDDISVDAAKAEINSMIEDLDLDAYAYYIYDVKALGNKMKAVLEMAIDPDSKVYLVGIGADAEESSILSAIEQLSGAVCGNLVSSEGGLAILDANGTLWQSFALTENIDSYEAYPIYTPYFDIKKADISMSYVSPDESGNAFGMLKIKANGIENEIKVYEETMVIAHGEGWLIYDGVLYISSLEDGTMGWNAYMNSVTRVEISEGITTLSANILAVENGTVISIPYTVQSIDQKAFGDAADITIEGYENSEAYTFATDNSITFVNLGAAGQCGFGVYWKYKDGTLTIYGTGSTLESGVTGYNKYAQSVWYDYYSKITKVIIGENIKTISSHDFHQMTELTTIEITSNLKVLEQGAFMTCPKLSTIYIKGNEPVVGTLDFTYITSIGTYCFDQGKSIENVILSDLTGTLGKEVFKVNYKLKAITIPAGVAGLDAEVFDSCTNLRELTVLGMDTSISPYAFASNTTSTASNYIDNIKIIAYKGSAAQRFAIDNGLVYKNIETGKETDYAALSDVSFLSFDGYQVRMDSYNGLRGRFVADHDAIASLESLGFEVVEYGTLVAATDNLESMGDELEIFGSEGNYSTLSYAVLITVMENGRMVNKHSLDSAENIVTYCCAVIELDEHSYNKNVSMRGYAVLRDADGNEYIFYSDCKNEAYRAVSLETVCLALAAEGTVTAENCISYADVLTFRSKDEDAPEFGDNEKNEDDFFG